jgi:hypothetical protein
MTAVVDEQYFLMMAINKRYFLTTAVVDERYFLTTAVIIEQYLLTTAIIDELSHPFTDLIPEPNTVSDFVSNLHFDLHLAVDLPQKLT